MKEITRYKVTQNSSIRKAVKVMDEGGIGFVVCVDEDDGIIGVLSDGDFRRAVLGGINLENRVLDIINKNFISVTAGFDEEEMENIFNKGTAQQIPILEAGKLVDIVTRDSFYCKKGGVESRHNEVRLPVVIMAGGKGNRLDPFTRILPKPLIPIGEKPVIEIIMDEYAKYGMKEFYVSINHKGNMIKAFFADYNVGYKIEYIHESKPLGTSGALKCLEGKVATPFFVTNCDVIIKADYGLIYKYHQDNKYALTLIGSMKHMIIPYGVCEIENGGLLKNIIEKPSSDILVNTGMYLLNPDVVSLIPENEYFDMTDLINKLRKLNMPIGLFPISADSWVDIGQLEEYTKAVNKLSSATL